MGSFMMHEDAEAMVPELKDFLNKTLETVDAYVWVQFFKEDEEVCFRFHAGEYLVKDREKRWEVNPRITAHDYHGEFRLTSLPGNANIAVSNGLWLNDLARGKGIGQFLQDFKKRLARKYLINVLYCTSLESNEVENYLLEKNGWKSIGKSKNYGGSNIIEWRLEL